MRKWQVFNHLRGGHQSYMTSHPIPLNFLLYEGIFFSFFISVGWALDCPLYMFFCQILTGEDWNVVMYDGIQAYGGIVIFATKIQHKNQHTNFCKMGGLDIAYDRPPGSLLSLLFVQFCIGQNAANVYLLPSQPRKPQCTDRPYQLPFIEYSYHGLISYKDTEP